MGDNEVSTSSSPIFIAILDMGIPAISLIKKSAHKCSLNCNENAFLDKYLTKKLYGISNMFIKHNEPAINNYDRFSLAFTAGCILSNIIFVNCICLLLLWESTSFGHS
uniref:Uncharacterized protein n=1 Tax=Glossina pallidipes TaxID=7398 RepID=A0A1B0AJF4_GLOPL